jgi:hypothetical protein
MTYKIITASGAANVATLILSTVDGLEVGTCVRIYNTGNNKIDGRRQLVTVNDQTDTVTFASPSIGTVAAFNPPNATLVPLTTWANLGDVQTFLGIAVATTNDEDFLNICIEAANEFCYLRRLNAGYIDSRCTIPNPAVLEAVILYAASLYRERGSVDSFQSYDAMSMPQPSLSMGRVLQLLGCGKPQVG